MDDARLARILAVGTLLVLALVVLLWLWPRATSPVGGELTAAQRPGVGPRIEGGVAASAEEQPPVEIVEGPTEAELPNPTKYCTTIVEWHRRNVPAWVMEDNMMAQGMKFDDQDLACLTAGGVPPQILDFAEQNTRRPQPTRR